MRKSILLSVLLALSVMASAEPRGPSTEEERKRAIDIIGKLERAPMNPELKQDREWVFQWIKEVPDVNVKICSALVRPLMEQQNSPERNALMLQSMLATAQFNMLHPDKVSDKVSGLMAGTEGMLRAYDNILKKDPAKRNDFLESLKQKQSEGQLASYVLRSAQECSKFPATVLNP